jgi:glycosyltransferase involved in cell wall biosynthesis
VRVSILNSGGQTHYLYGLVTGLAHVPGLQIEVVDSDKSVGLFDDYGNVTHVNLRGSQNPRASLGDKTLRLLTYYWKLVRYAATTRSEVLHIQWQNRFQLLDRTLLILYYKLLGKKLVITAHNVSEAKRDGVQSYPDTLSLRVMYSLVDHIIVHTQAMKRELIEDFRTPEAKIDVIPHGINNRVAHSGLSRDAARSRLGIGRDKKVSLFFGRIDRYKGLELLIEAFGQVAADDPDHALVIAGRPDNCPDYIAKVMRLLDHPGRPGRSAISTRFEKIPDGDLEAYFTAADCLVLPYTAIYQSGVLFLSFAYGLPVIATDVGSFRDDIIDGFNGYVCPPGSPDALADALRKYFASPLHDRLADSRHEIKRHAEEKYSWLNIGRTTSGVYERLARRAPASGPAGSGRPDGSRAGGVASRA